MEALLYLRIKARVALSRFVKDQRGLETIEIVLIAALLIIGSIAAWRYLGKGITTRLESLCTEIVDANQKCK